VVRTFLGLPAPIETACENQKSSFHHLLFSVEPKTSEKSTGDWKQLAEESLANYVEKNCAEGVLVQAVHGNILQLEVAMWFAGPGRHKKFLRESLRNRVVRKSLPGSPNDWKVDSKCQPHAEDSRVAAVYDSLRERVLVPSLGGWRLVLDHTPRGGADPCASQCRRLYAQAGRRGSCRWPRRPVLITASQPKEPTTGL